MKRHELIVDRDWVRSILYYNVGNVCIALRLL